MKRFLLIAVLCIAVNVLFGQTELFGVATSGGQLNIASGVGSGAIFKIDSNATNFTSQYISTAISGYGPYNGSLVEANDGMMYGYDRRQAGWSMLVLFQYDFRKNVFIEKYNSTSGLDGKEPKGSLIQASNGLLYGVMNQGGVNDFGTLYSYNPVTNQFAKKIDFNITIGTYPEGSLFEASNGKIYGMARAGGLYNYGTMFEYNPITNTVIPLVHFDGSNANTGANPKGTMMQGSDGLLYGMTTGGGGTASSGIIFSYDLTTNTFTKRKDFSASTGPWGIGYGVWPNGALIEGVDGNFYGLTMGDIGVWPCSGGTIFQFNPSTNSIITKSLFSLSLGTNPNGSLILATDGNFYGLTTNTLGGNTGSLFKYDYLNDIFTSKFYFDGNDYGGSAVGSLVQASNGKLYGMTKEGGSSRQSGQVVNMGTLFEYDLVMDTLNKKLDFGLPYNGQLGALMYSNGKLYGTTGYGGIHDDGTIFEFDLGSREYKKLYDYDEYATGSWPYMAPAKVNDSTFYVISSSGGVNGKGTVLKFNPTNFKFTKMLDLVSGNNAGSPNGNLLLASDGMLYGLSYNGGNANIGALYQYNPITNVYTNKFNFNSTTTGYYPVGKLLQASNGKLYGVAANGGTYNYGTLFQYDIATNTFTKKNDFNTASGSAPTSSLIQDMISGKIYGLTSGGGINNKGVLFQYDPIANVYTKKIDFDGTNFGYPSLAGTLIQEANGSIVGTTSHGGLSGSGVVFKYDAINNILTKTYDFVQNTGTMPRLNSLVEVPILPLAQITTSISNICKMDSVILPYSTSGIFNVGNIFTVELSNAYGYFSTSTVIGTFTANTSGTLTVAIPSVVVNGTGYKFRINGSNPYTIGYSTIGNVIISQPILSFVSGSDSICIGSSTTLNLTGANSYSWNTGATTSSVSVAPLATTPYTVTGTDLNNCTNTQTISVLVDNTCADVWPGDANSDGIADNLDVLELGLHYTQTGAPRAITSNLWQSYHATNWIGTITNGKNLNHSDCNGDGIINDDDTLAIFNNYNLTHAFKPEQITTNSALTIVPDQSSVAKATWGTSSIYLGDATTIINTINGIAYTINFDNTLFETDSVWIEYPTSFINASNQNLKFRKRDFTNGKLYTATTHTISGNVSGYGKIATLHYKIKSTLATDNVLNLSIAQANQSDASGVITTLTAGSATLTALGTSITTNLNTLTNGNYISLNPNPTNGALIINSTTELQKVEVMAITGQLLLSEVPSSTSHSLHLDHLANGIYFVNLYQNNRIVKREKIILNK